VITAGSSEGAGCVAGLSLAVRVSGEQPLHLMVNMGEEAAAGVSQFDTALLRIAGSSK
jgi:hypothetical protein